MIRGSIGEQCIVTGDTNVVERRLVRGDATDLQRLRNMWGAPSGFDNSSENVIYLREDVAQSWDRGDWTLIPCAPFLFVIQDLMRKLWDLEPKRSINYDSTFFRRPHFFSFIELRGRLPFHADHTCIQPDDPVGNLPRMQLNCHPYFAIFAAHKAMSVEPFLKHRTYFNISEEILNLQGRLMRVEAQVLEIDSDTSMDDEESFSQPDGQPVHVEIEEDSDEEGSKEELTALKAQLELDAASPHPTPNISAWLSQMYPYINEKQMENQRPKKIYWPHPKGAYEDRVPYWRAKGNKWWNEADPKERTPPPSLENGKDWTTHHFLVRPLGHERDQLVTPLAIECLDFM